MGRKPLKNKAYPCQNGKIMLKVTGAALLDVNGP
jgi:hypothetical protein